MGKEFFQIINGYKVWKLTKRKYQIDYHYVIIVCPENNYEWNHYVFEYLPDYMERKKADKALIILSSTLKEKNHELHSNYYTLYMNDFEILCLMRFYCLNVFFDNIVFFYLNFPNSNKNQFILSNSKVSMEELICLGIYRLRKVPTHV